MAFPLKHTRIDEYVEKTLGLCVNVVDDLDLSSIRLEWGAAIRAGSGAFPLCPPWFRDIHTTMYYHPTTSPRPMGIRLQEEIQNRNDQSSTALQDIIVS